MATTNSVGTTGRDYSTLQAWEDAVPATPTGGYIGECYNDSEFSDGVSIAGHTTSASNFVTLTAATGQSFQDHASVRTNPLYYDQTNGVGVNASPGGISIIYCTDDWVTISRLQLKRTTGSYAHGLVDIDAFVENTKVKDCILLKAVSAAMTMANMRSSHVINCALISEGATAGIAIICGATGTNLLLNNTIVKVGTANGVGIEKGGYGAAIAKNNAIFNWTSNTTGSFDAASGYNATNAASAPGSNNQVSKTFANQFESVTNDFRAKSGADLIGTGNTDATNAPNDISGFTRGATTAGDIGAWEFGGGGAFTLTADAMRYVLTGAAATLTPARKIIADAVAYALRGTDVTLKNSRLAADVGAFAYAGSAATLIGPAAPLTAQSGAFVFTGAAPNVTASNRTMTAASVAFALAGGDVTLKVSRITADAIVFALTGSAASLTAARRLTADAMTKYALTGAAAALNPGHAMTAAAMAYALSGTDIGWLLTRAAGADGTFTLTLKDATLTYSGGGSQTLTAEAMRYVLTGKDAALTRAEILTADAMAYALTGKDASLLAARLLTGGIGAFLMNGADAALTVPGASVLTANAGAFELVGKDAAFIRALLLAAASGAFSMQGAAAGLLPGHALSAEAMAYLLSGHDFAAAFTRLLSADPGVFTLRAGSPTLIADAVIIDVPAERVRMSPRNGRYLIH